MKRELSENDSSQPSCFVHVKKLGPRARKSIDEEQKNDTIIQHDLSFMDGAHCSLETISTCRVLHLELFEHTSQVAIHSLLPTDCQNLLLESTLITFIPSS
jgi:hypothetical protein